MADVDGPMPELKERAVDLAIKAGATGPNVVPLAREIAAYISGADQRCMIGEPSAARFQPAHERQADRIINMERATLVAKVARELGVPLSAVEMAGLGQALGMGLRSGTSGV